jgi:formate/nitrite transporter FocA (FNT family)
MVFEFDAFSPQQIADRVENIGVAKTRLPLLSMIMLGILAGAFIGLGALYYVIVASDGGLGFAASRVVGGLCFSLPGRGLFRGVLCNVLICMAVWMSFAGRSVVDRAVAIVFPISAFVAAGFEHSIANMYFIPLAMMLKAAGAGLGAGAEAISVAGFFRNLVPVIAGNIVGGSVPVVLVYHVVYRRGARL